MEILDRLEARWDRVPWRELSRGVTILGVCSCSLRPVGARSLCLLSWRYSEHLQSVGAALDD